MLSANVAGGTQPYTYTWYFNMSLAGNSSTYSPSQNGIYTLKALKDLAANEE